MATNNFKPFATAANANVISQANWEALPALLSGFTAGKASSAQVNKAIRQATTIAALVGQFIANSGADALDNADVNGLVTKFTNALIANLRLGVGAPAIGIPFFWPSSAMPNTVMTEWADMVFLKFNGATFSAATYPKLALVFPGLVLTESRGEFLRVWDDGRGVDSGRELLSAQSGQIQSHNHAYDGIMNVTNQTVWSNTTGNGTRSVQGAATTYSGGSETRPRNIAFNFLVRAK
ncbi:phage tail protein [Escherichia coli]|uniref:phage tail protein n=1 Tax=Escherichia coli TaxID=562 RepID=UPI0021CEDF8C|nr:phage tail protein [Escherichia coli]MCU6445618.1 phage tail protein [Escherichia coli]MCU6457429.1 phage tail protein [Escherichia coli]MCU6489138.1 phage tail protein [Escherichia coli]